MQERPREARAAAEVARREFALEEVGKKHTVAGCSGTPDGGGRRHMRRLRGVHHVGRIQERAAASSVVSARRTLAPA